MQALREICLANSKWKPLEDYILRVETYVDNGPLVADNCKCILESICKTILDDLGVPKEKQSIKLHELVKQTVEQLGGINKSPDLVSSFTNTALKIAEFRNEYTETGHGQSVYAIEGNRKKVTAATITFLSSIIEHTALYLITVYQDEYPKFVKSKPRYEDGAEFNESFDDQNDPIQIGEYGPYSPSEALFYIDEDAYKAELVNFINKA